jgi:hypothetical protein
VESEPANPCRRRRERYETSRRPRGTNERLARPQTVAPNREPALPTIDAVLEDIDAAAVRRDRSVRNPRGVAATQALKFADQTGVEGNTPPLPLTKRRLRDVFGDCIINNRVLLFDSCGQKEFERGDLIWRKFVKHPSKTDKVVVSPCDLNWMAADG